MAIPTKRDGTAGIGDADTWRAAAAYLYTLTLNPSELAWEYLRRNAEYRRDWHERSKHSERAASRWHMATFENAYLDARAARPTWQRDAQTVRLIPDTEEACDGAATFSLWSVPGRKGLDHDGASLRLTLRSHERSVRLAVADELQEGGAFAYVVRADAYLADTWQSIACCDALLRGSHRSVTPDLVAVASRSAIASMRSLQAMDGRMARASHRAIASALFGETDVTRRWHADGELRAQVRHLLRRGEAMVNGGYAALLTNVGRPCQSQPRSAEGGGR